jgi:hypothetical protein
VGPAWAADRLGSDDANDPTTKTRPDVVVGAASREEGGGLGRLGVVVDDEHLRVPGRLCPTVSPPFWLVKRWLLKPRRNRRPRINDMHMTDR